MKADDSEFMQRVKSGYHQHSDMQPRPHCRQCEEMGMICHAHLVVQYSYMKYLIDDLGNAIKREGPNPRLHHRVQRRHRRQWPTLWKKIDRLLEWRARHS